MSMLLQDFKYGLRTLRNNPGFTAVAVIALALGIGANTAIFSVVNGVLLQPLPYANPGRLVQLSERTPDFSTASVAYPNFLDWKDQNRSFGRMTAYRWEDYDVTGSGQPEHLNGKMVSADFFRVFGAHPILGRDFAAAEDRLGTTSVAIISAGLWKRRFGGSPDVLGRQLTLNAHDYTIVGVISERFEFRGEADVFTLMGQWDDILPRSRDMHPGIYVAADLKPGVTIAQAQADMQGIAERLAEAYPKSNSRHGINVMPLAQVIVGNVRPTLLLLLGAVSFTLLIACANVANLLLARSAARRREMAIRSAMGAHRGRLARQLLTESVMLALAGGLAGLLIAKWGTQAVLAAVPGGLPRMESIGVDASVLAFTLAVSLFTGIVFGLAPVLQISVCDVHETLKEGSRGSTSGQHRSQSLLVVSEVAAALVLLIGAGLMLRTMWQLNAVHPGFDPRNVLIFSIGLSPANAASSERIFQTFNQTVDRIKRAPGVKNASMSALIPLTGRDSEIPFYVNGRPRPATQGDMLWSLLYATGPGYLETMGIPLLRGRFIGPQDTASSMHIVVVDDVLARSVFPNEDPIGKSIAVADLGGGLPPDLVKPMVIVGVVGHVKHWGLDSDATASVRNELYVPFEQIPEPFVKAEVSGTALVVRTSVDPLNLVADIRRAVLEAGGDQTVFGVQTMEQIISASLAGRRFSMLLLGIFAGLALLLAAVGIYGVISNFVAQRTHEIGIRMALGARPRDVLSAVVARGMMPVFAGLALGIVAAFALTRLMAHMLYGIQASDPPTFVGVAAVLAGVALLASYVPARRAMRIDPAVALRHE